MPTKIQLQNEIEKLRAKIASLEGAGSSATSADYGEPENLSTDGTGRRIGLYNSLNRGRVVMVTDPDGTVTIHKVSSPEQGIALMAELKN